MTNLLPNPVPIRHIADRNGMEIFSAAQKMKVRENFAKLADAQINMVHQISDATVKDIIAHLIRYGGRIEVKNFGTFYVREINEKKRKPGMGKKPVRAPYFRIEFKQSRVLRDMINEDIFSTDVATRNTMYFVEPRNILL
jgi:nucleoid DNA-binding protein